MAENKLDKRTRKILQGNTPDQGKEAGAYQSAEKQLLAIQAEQQQNLEMAKLSAKSDANQTNLLSQAANVMADSTEQSASGGMEVINQQVNPATQTVLNKYGLGQPKFRKQTSSTQQVTKQNVVINNNTTNQTTNNVTVPANIGGPLQGRPIQFKPGSNAGLGGVNKFKLWLNQVFDKNKEEARKRDREYERRELSLTKSANKMMRKLEELGRTMAERLDPRKIGTTLMSQVKSILFLLGMGFLAVNWNKILENIDKIEKSVVNFTHWLGIGQKEEGDSGLVKALKSILANNEDDPRSLGEILKDIFYTEEGSKKKGIINILMEYFDDLIADRKKALDQVLGKPLDIGMGGDSVIERALSAAFKGFSTKLGEILTAIVSGTKGLNKILGERKANEVTEKTANTAKNSFQVASSQQSYFKEAGKIDKSSAYYDKDNKTFMGDAAGGKSTPYSFDYDKNGNLISASAATRQGNAIVKALQDKKATRTDEVIAGFKKVDDYLTKNQKESDGRRYIIWNAEKLKAIREAFGINAEDSEWKSILETAKKHGAFKYVKRKLTPAEKEYLAKGLENYRSELGIGGMGIGIKVQGKLGELNLKYQSKKKELTGKDYIYELVPVSDKRAGVKNAQGQIVGGTAYGIDKQLFDRIRHLIQKYSDYKGEKSGDELQFDLSDTNSVKAIENALHKSKLGKLYEKDSKVHNFHYDPNYNSNPQKFKQDWYNAHKNDVTRTMAKDIEKMEANDESSRDIDYANEKLKRNIGESNAMETAKGVAKTVDAVTNTIADKTGIDAVRTDAQGKVEEVQEALTTDPENTSWQNPYKNGKGFIALVGDSYAHGMATHFVNDIKSKGGQAKATKATNSNDHSKYCVVGATLSTVIPQTQVALRDGASIIVFHIGINNWGDDDNTVKNKLNKLIGIANTGQAKIYFAAPIVGQPKKVIKGGKETTLGNCVRQYNTVLKSTCKVQGIGVLNLEGTSGKYKNWDKEGIHPTGNSYSMMAKDLVALMEGKKIPLNPPVSPGQVVSQGSGKVGSATGTHEQIIAYAVNHFIKKGYTPEQAAGIVGNLIREGLLTKDYGNTYKDGNGPSAGIAGFHSYYDGRKGELDNLKAYASKVGKDWRLLGTQLDYITDGSEDAKRALGKIKSATSVADSAKIWGHDYERFKGYQDYGNQNYKNRISSGHDALSIYERNKSNISNQYSATGAGGGSYRGGNYSEGYNSSEGGSGFEEGSIAEKVSDFFGGGSSIFGKIMGELANMATHIWDYIVPAAKDVKEAVEEKIGDVGEAIEGVVSGKDDKIADVYTGTITKELKSYNEYLKNPGKLPKGLDETDWRKAVREETGDFPEDLGPINSNPIEEVISEKEEQKAEVKKESSPITEVTKEKAEETKPEEVTYVANDGMYGMAKALVTGDYSSVLKTKDKKEELMAKIVDLLEKGNTTRNKSVKYQEVQIEATGKVVDVTAQGAALMASATVSNKTRSREQRPNPSMADTMNSSTSNLISG